MLTVKGMGAAMNAGRKFVAKHEDTISKGANVAVVGLGTAVELTGKLVSKGAGSLGGYLHEKAARSEHKATRIAGHAAGYTANAAGLLGVGTAKVGALTSKLAPAVGGAVGGGVRGAVAAVSGAVDTVAITEGDCERLRRQLLRLGRDARDRSDRKQAAIEAARQARRKGEMLDLLVVGGISLSAALKSPADVPAEVLRAYELAYPRSASQESFTVAVDRMSSDGLLGFVNGVKGKLFEIELVDHMNNGNLPEGWHAEMAQSATQPGWDIRVLDEHGAVADEVQAKATESVDYVRQALERYPDIDVTTTSEVFAHMTALEMTHHVTDSGIPEAALEGKVTAATDAAGNLPGLDSFVPSTLGLAVIALSSFMDKTLTLQQRGAEFGSRSAAAGLATGAAHLAMVATQTWFLGLMAGVGASWLMAKGRAKRERLEALRQMVASLSSQSKGTQPELQTPSGQLRLQ